MQVEDDGKGWVWLAAEMSPGGLAVELFKSVPYGKRAILVAKQSNVDELFQKVGMSVAFDAVASRGYKGWLGVGQNSRAAALILSFASCLIVTLRIVFNGHTSSDLIAIRQVSLQRWTGTQPWPTLRWRSVDLRQEALAILFNLFNLQYPHLATLCVWKYPNSTGNQGHCGIFPDF